MKHKLVTNVSKVSKEEGSYDENEHEIGKFRALDPKEK